MRARPFLLASVLSAFVLALPGGASAQSNDPEKVAEAKKHMQAGAAFYNDPSGHKCEEAYLEFKKAYDLVGTANPLKGMAVCSLELERDGDAIKEYEKYLQLKGTQVPADERAQIEADLKALRAALATVTLTSDRPGFRVVDVRTPATGYPVTNKYTASDASLSLGLHPGTHTFTASSDGAPDVVWKVEVANGATLSHAYDFAAAIAEEEQRKKDAAPKNTTTVVSRPVPTSVFVVGGLTIALAIPTAIFGVRALQKESDYKAQNGHEPIDAAQSQRDDVKSANLITDIFLGVTAVGLVTTTVLFVTRPTKTTPKVGWSITPTTHGGAAELHGSF